MTAAVRKARVLVVEDHPIFREGLAQLINRQPDLTVCAEAATPQEAIAAVEKDAPEIAVLDLMLNGAGGIELIKQLHALFPQLRLLVLSMHDENVYAERVLRAGASGYVMKQEASGTVIAAIREVLAGEATRDIATRLGLSVKTIETHRENIKHKLELPSGVELVVRARAWIDGQS